MQTRGRLTAHQCTLLSMGRFTDSIICDWLKAMRRDLGNRRSLRALVTRTFPVPNPGKLHYLTQKHPAHCPQQCVEITHASMSNIIKVQQIPAAYPTSCSAYPRSFFAFISASQIALQSSALASASTCHTGVSEFLSIVCDTMPWPSRCTASFPDTIQSSFSNSSSALFRHVSRLHFPSRYFCRSMRSWFNCVPLQFGFLLRLLLR